MINYREKIAKMLSAEAREIIFTASGTEANNTAIMNVQNSRAKKIITSAIALEEGAISSETSTFSCRGAMDIAGEGDVVFLLGKGHEEYEIDENGKHPFSERLIVCDYYEKMKAEGRI